jgi:hypothetical protein
MRQTRIRLALKLVLLGKKSPTPPTKNVDRTTQISLFFWLGRVQVDFEGLTWASNPVLKFGSGTNFRNKPYRMFIFTLSSEREELTPGGP